jgi:hypothetical protein
MKPLTADAKRPVAISLTRDEPSDGRDALSRVRLVLPPMHEPRMSRHSAATPKNTGATQRVPTNAARPFVHHLAP